MKKLSRGKLHAMHYPHCLLCLLLAQDDEQRNCAAGSWRSSNAWSVLSLPVEAAHPALDVSSDSLTGKLAACELPYLHKMLVLAADTTFQQLSPNLTAV